MKNKFYKLPIFSSVSALLFLGVSILSGPSSARASDGLTNVSCSVIGEGYGVQVDYAYGYYPNPAPESGMHTEVKSLEIFISTEAGGEGLSTSILGGSLRNAEAIDADGTQQLTYKLKSDDSSDAFFLQFLGDSHSDNFMSINYKTLGLDFLDSDTFKGANVQCKVNTSKNPAQ